LDLFTDANVEMSRADGLLQSGVESPHRDTAGGAESDDADVRERESATAVLTVLSLSQPQSLNQNPLLC